MIRIKNYLIILDIEWNVLKMVLLIFSGMIVWGFCVYFYDIDISKRLWKNIFGIIFLYSSNSVVYGLIYYKNWYEDLWKFSRIFVYIWYLILIM